MVILIFSIAIIAVTLIIGLSITSLFFNKIQFWPPPRGNTWQYRLFWLLFRVLILAIILLSIIDFHGLGSISVPRFFIGVLMAGTGFGAALFATFYLGWRNAHGEAEGLKTTGWYCWSRNPIYVVSIIGMLGVGIFVNSFYLNVVLVLWAFIYIAAPFLEEPWLEEKYGEEYLNYKNRVPRFMGKLSFKP